MQKGYTIEKIHCLKDIKFLFFTYKKQKSPMNFSPSSLFIKNLSYELKIVFNALAKLATPSIVPVTFSD